VLEASFFDRLSPPVALRFSPFPKLQLSNDAYNSRIISALRAYSRYTVLRVSAISPVNHKNHDHR
jgi:hypothetical protein